MRIKIPIKFLIITTAVIFSIIQVPADSYAASRDKILHSLRKSGTINEVNKIDISLPDVKNSYNYLVINDSHIIVQSKEITDKETIKTRLKVFNHNRKETSAQSFRTLMKKADSMRLNGIILNGDIIDEYTAANLASVYNSVKNVRTPVIFLRSDHDTKSWWAEKADKKRAAAYEKRLGITGDVTAITEREIVLAGWNDSYKNIDPKQKTRLVRLIKGSKPVILFSHVPFSIKKPRGFGAFVKDRRGECIFWGRGGVYEPGDATADLIHLLDKGRSSPAAIICGHIHHGYSGRLGGGVKEYICPPFFEGGVTLLTVH